MGSLYNICAGAVLLGFLSACGGGSSNDEKTEIEIATENAEVAASNVNEARIIAELAAREAAETDSEEIARGASQRAEAASINAFAYARDANDASNEITTLATLDSIDDYSVVLLSQEATDDAYDDAFAAELAWEETKLSLSSFKDRVVNDYDGTWLASPFCSEGVHTNNEGYVVGSYTYEFKVEGNDYSVTRNFYDTDDCSGDLRVGEVRHGTVYYGNDVATGASVCENAIEVDYTSDHITTVEFDEEDEIDQKIASNWGIGYLHSLSYSLLCSDGSTLYQAYSSTTSEATRQTSIDDTVFLIKSE